jgi:hypothetical protein
VEEYTTDLQKAITLAAVLLIALGVFLGAAQLDTAMPATAVVPTMQPTPALVVPTARPLAPRSLPTPATVNIYSGGDVTYVHQDVNVCIGLCR